VKPFASPLVGGDTLSQTTSVQFPPSFIMQIKKRGWYPIFLFVPGYAKKDIAHFH
jgi:hypothetical protein